MTDLGLRTGKQNNRHLIIPQKKRHPEVPNVFFLFCCQRQKPAFTGQGFRQKHLLRVTLD